jgi:hypothetical protein
VGEGEAQVLLGELADVRSLDVLGLLELDDTEDLKYAVSNCDAGSVVRGEFDVRGWT